MNSHLKIAAAMLVSALCIAPASVAQRRSGETTADNTLETPIDAGIAWFGSWSSGLAEAQRTDRPILLMSAAPQCHGVPGMW